MVPHTSKKRLAYLVSEYPAISHTFIFREIQALRGLGFDVKTTSILKPKKLDKMTADERKDASKTYYIKSIRLIRIIHIHFLLLFKSPIRYIGMFIKAFLLSRKGPVNLIKMLGYIAEAGILCHWMKKNNLKHVHVHFANPASTVAMIAQSYGQITYSLSVHGPDIFYNVNANLLHEKIKSASAIRCISYYCQSQLMKIVPYTYWAKFHIIRCGIDPMVFSPRKDPGNNVPQILCIGRLVPAKGQHILLEACACLKTRNIKHHLYIVGDGEDRESLEQHVKELNLEDSVTFTGALGQDDVHRYYNDADIFVLPSFAEGLPVVLMEAMGKQIPCITSRITGIPELISDGHDGMLFAPSDVMDLVEKLKRLIKNPCLGNKLGVCGRKKVTAYFDLNKNCIQMADFFNTALFQDHHVNY